MEVEVEVEAWGLAAASSLRNATRRRWRCTRGVTRRHWTPMAQPYNKFPLSLLPFQLNLSQLFPCQPASLPASLPDARFTSKMLLLSYEES